MGAGHQRRRRLRQRRSGFQLRSQRRHAGGRRLERRRQIGDRRARPNSDGSLVWALDTNGDGVFDTGDAVYSYGAATDHPIVGDWTASGRDAIGVYRPDPAHNTQVFTLDANGNGVFNTGDQIFTFGEPGDTVIVGKWKPPGQPLQSAGEPPALRNGPILTARGVVAAGQRSDRHLDGDGAGRATDRRSPASHRTGGTAAERSARLPGRRNAHLVAQRRRLRLVRGPDASGQFRVHNADIFRFAGPRGSPAAGRMDLLTAVLHEEGHALGLPDLNPAVYPNDVMTGTLNLGVRRLPLPGEATSPGQT